MLRRTVYQLLLVSALSLEACSFTIGGNAAAPDPPTAAAPEHEESPLGRIEQGMDKEEVTEILGFPTLRTPLGDTLMPSEFMPEMWSYRGMGRIYFSGADPRTTENSGVVRVEIDPTEEAQAPPPPPPYGVDD